MADTNLQNDNAFENDPFDINELASLNEDISPEFIAQLQNQVAQGLVKEVVPDENDDSTLFEEVKPQEETEQESPETATSLDSPQEQVEQKRELNEDIDDNYINKYKAKLNKQENSIEENKQSYIDENAKPTEINDTDKEENSNKIAVLSEGNITEKPITQELIEYSDSLDLLDDNVRYSKYVIYIDPNNAEYIAGLTVKERKNLINRIIKEQGDIAITKYKFGKIQAVIKHIIVAIITISVSIPIIYSVINASLEASINNYRRSQSLFQVLYKEHGKVNSIKKK